MCKGSMYNYKSDIWMVGCVIYETCSFNKPFSGQTFHALMQNIISGVHCPVPDIYSNELKKLIDLLLTKNPDDRPMIQDLLNQQVFIKEKYENFLESKKKIDLNVVNLSDKKLIKINYQTLSRNKEEMMKPNNSSYYFESNPFEVNELKVMINKGYESTPLKKIKDTISGTAHSTNDSYTKLTKFYMSNSEVMDTRTKLRKASMGFINQTQVKNNVTDSEFFDSEKQISKNPIRKCDSQKTNNTTPSHISFSKVPIKITKQRLPPHVEANKEFLIFKQDKNGKNKSNNKKDFNPYENKTENVNYDIVFNSQTNSNIKLMFNFLKEKIGEKLSDQLLNLINFSSDESIRKSLIENDEKMKMILGSYYKQVVHLIMHIVKFQPPTNNTPIISRVSNENTIALENEYKSNRSHKKHNSVGCKTTFDKNI